MSNIIVPLEATASSMVQLCIRLASKGEYMSRHIYFIQATALD